MPRPTHGEWHDVAIPHTDLTSRIRRRHCDGTLEITLSNAIDIVFRLDRNGLSWFVSIEGGEWDSEGLVGVAAQAESDGSLRWVRHDNDSRDYTTAQEAIADAWETFLSRHLEDVA